MDRGRLKEETVHGSVKFPLAVYKQDGDDKFVVKLHWHNETEIIFLERGSFTIDINMKKIKCKAPAFLFVGAGDIHAIAGEQECRESAVVFDMKMLSFEYLDGVQQQIIKPILDKNMLFPQTVSEKSRSFDTLRYLYRKIFEEAGKDSAASRMRVKAALFEMLACLYENGSFMNMESGESYDSDKIERVKKVLGYIQGNYHTRITSSELAAVLDMNEQYFCRYFKKITGKTPVTYINEVRIEKAAEYLLKTNRKIIDIAMECGYENMGYFIRRFKEQKGVNPSKYRQESQNSVINSQNG